MSQESARPNLLESLNRVAEVLQAESDPEQALLRLAHIVKEHMDADGAKVLVVKRGVKAPELSALCRTDLSVENLQRSEPVELSDEKGLADWVIFNRTWLLIPEIHEQRPATAPLLKGLTGIDREVEVVARLEKELVDAKEDEEFTLLMVPLHTGGQPAGVLGVWRDDQRPFVAPQDPEELEKIAPYVAATCRQVLQRKTLESELDAISALANALHGAKSLADAYGAVAAGVGGLSAALHAVLLHHDPDRPGNLYQRDTWSASGGEFEGEVREMFRGLHIACGTGRDWKHGVKAGIETILASRKIESLVVRPDRILGMAKNGDGFPSLAVVLLDHRSNVSGAAFFADDLRGHAAFSFLHYAGSMLDSHVEMYPRKILEEIGGHRDEALENVDKVLERAARVLLEATSSSGALVYSGFEEGMQVTSSAPHVETLIGLDVTRGSLTEESISSQEILRVVDTGDPEDLEREKLDSARLDEIRSAFGWSRLRSWLACPLVDQERCIGVIKLLTADQDTFLGKDHEVLAKVVARRAAWEIHKLNRRLMLEELNHMANRLTEESGKPLGEELIRELEEWAGRFVRPGAKVAVITRILPDKPLVNRVSTGVGSDFLDKLQVLSRQWGDKLQKWDRRAVLEGPGIGRVSLEMAGCAVPIRLPKKTFLQGHLILLHRRKNFVEVEIEAAGEAARELGLILNAERLRRQWVEGVGRFRHAVLGPVQGLASRAKALALLCEERKVGGEQVQKLKNQIEEEAEVVRLWRHNQRLYLSDSVEIRKRRNSLKKVFDRCIERYRPILQTRNVTIRGDWPRQGGELQFLFDDKALDLALSNLLDNARKYSFYNTTVVVGVISRRDTIQIWVEDLGHRIPKGKTDLIYQKNYRMDWQDPFRTIGGEGLGLPMVKAIVEAHDGRLKHLCRPMTGAPKSETKPYLVRFTIELPTLWGR